MKPPVKFKFHGRFCLWAFPKEGFGKGGLLEKKIDR